MSTKQKKEELKELGGAFSGLSRAAVSTHFLSLTLSLSYRQAVW
jgi:hypothetical protein